MLASFALAVAVNCRGLADTFPTRSGFGPIWQEWSPAMVRATFALFGAIGAIVFVAETVRLLA